MAKASKNAPPQTATKNGSSSLETREYGAYRGWKYKSNSKLMHARNALH